MKTGTTTDDYIPSPNYSREDWEELSDNPEWTREDFAKAKPFAEVFPELAQALERRRAQVKNSWEITSQHLDQSALDPPTAMPIDGPWFGA